MEDVGSEKISTEDLKEAATFRIESSPTQGRFVVANRNIGKGEIIFVSKPWAVVVAKNYKKYCCNTCLKLIDKNFAIKCDECSDTWFCGKLCESVGKVHNKLINGTMLLQNFNLQNSHILLVNVLHFGKRIPKIKLCSLKVKLTR